MAPGEGCGGVGSGHPIGSARAAGKFARGVRFDLKRGEEPKKRREFEEGGDEVEVEPTGGRSVPA